MYYKYSLFLILLLTGMAACVEPYSVKFGSAKEYIVVDGVVTDMDGPQYIKLSKTNPESKNESSEFSQTIWTTGQSTLPLTKARAKVIVNDSQVFELTETDPGVYALPALFKGKVGDSYKLQFVTETGTNYESSSEKMLPVTAVTSAYDVFNPKGLPKYSAYYGDFTPSNDIYINFDDPAGEQNFYRWQWTLWEVQKSCATCNQGKYYLFQAENGIDGDCFKDLTLKYNNIYDYTCEDLCWDIFYSSDITIFSDIYTNGQSQKDKLVAQIPLLQSNPCLVSLQQNSLTPNAYRFLKLIQDQAVNSGTLADTPPAPIQGNILNTSDKNELIIGFFTASSVAEYKTMLWRKNVKNQAVLNQLFKTIHNRDQILEERSPERPYIPLAICKNSRSRTPFLPKDWKWTQ
ncbi:DUF4249 domain-containing protein [Dyadobacter subterraneus]|uniref:DUF4249 domain-containing protein n=1 Tax=Dyadobacter subterraneus TaxID=2773304 RepID=A0ABR9WHK7_9BACT|nr:DUF4249 domain-containing protein [Dyadobacter subterraneus]MBE9464999.1 DUF4249 domain-containing protein [Dyadobacter subterraneus]